MFESEIRPSELTIPGWTEKVKIIYHPDSPQESYWRCSAIVEAMPSETVPKTMMTIDSIFILKTDKPRSPEMSWQSEFPYRHSSNEKASGTAAMVDIPPNAQRIKCKVFYTIEDLGNANIETLGVEYKLTYRKEKEFWLGY